MTVTHHDSLVHLDFEVMGGGQDNVPEAEHQGLQVLQVQTGVPGIKEAARVYRAMSRGLGRREWRDGCVRGCPGGECVSGHAGMTQVQDGNAIH